MATHVALLRAVNVGGLTVKMADLRELALAQGWSDVATYLNSGNLLLTSEDDAATVADKLGRALKARYERDVAVDVRTPDDLADVVERQPLSGDEKRLHVGFLGDVPDPGARERLGDIAPEECVVDGREAFLHYPNGLGRSKLTNAVLEKALGVTVTVRGLRTVTGLLERS